MWEISQKTNFKNLKAFQRKKKIESRNLKEEQRKHKGLAFKGFGCTYFATQNGENCTCLAHGNGEMCMQHCALPATPAAPRSLPVLPEVFRQWQWRNPLHVTACIASLTGGILMSFRKWHRHVSHPLHVSSACMASYV